MAAQGRRSMLVRGAVLGAIAAVVAVAWVGATRWQADPAGAQLDRTVLVPPSGQVAADFVDGHPVFVVHDVDGTVRVLDAVSPHSPVGPGSVLAWCRTVGLFEDLWYGSQFTDEGAYVGGPAPTGMAPYRVPALADVAVVGPRLPAPQRPAQAAEVDVVDPTLGESCAERTALAGPGYVGLPSVMDDLVVHRPTPGAARLWYPTRDAILGRSPRLPATTSTG